jgi:S-methylmethionine-dependent homocysteine/selenocysteine methylase
VASTLLDDERGRDGLRAYHEPYLRVAKEHGVGVVLDTRMWRANGPDWGAVLGYSPEQLDDVNRRAVGLIDELRGETNVLISGCCGTDERHIGEMCKAAVGRS